jgi:hypothetical protein
MPPKRDKKKETSSPAKTKVTKKDLARPNSNKPVNASPTRRAT